MTENSFEDRRVAELIKRIHAARKQVDALRPIDPALEKKIQDRFRLEWNYHSNSLEGNQLTYGETKSFLLHNLTASGKPLKDHLDLRGHNEALGALEDIVKNQEPITEVLIRNLHKLILPEPYEMPAETPSGERTVRQVQPGEYKKFANHVRTASGEILRFTEPQNVPPEMEELIANLNGRVASGEEPLVTAVWFHFRFIQIHPFDDGNGRMTRILMNLILLRAGYPPVIVRTEDRDEYLRTLQMADGGNLSPFVLFIGEALERSLDIWLRGARGEELDDNRLLDMDIALLKRRLEGEEKLQVPATAERIAELLEGGLAPFVQRLREELLRFESLFMETRWEMSGIGVHGGALADAAAFNARFEERVTEIRNQPPPNVRSSQLLRIDFHFRGLKHSISTPGLQMACTVLLEEFKYALRAYEVGAPQFFEVAKFYHQDWTAEEQVQFLMRFKKHILHWIKARTQST